MGAAPFPPVAPAIDRAHLETARLERSRAGVPGLTAMRVAAEPWDRTNPITPA